MTMLKLRQGVGLRVPEEIDEGEHVRLLVAAVAERQGKDGSRTVRLVFWEPEPRCHNCGEAV